MGETKNGYQPKDAKPQKDMCTADSGDNKQEISTYTPKKGVNKQYISTKPDVDYVNHPPHYTSRPMECIDEMLTVFGEKAVFWFCSVTAWKYRHRAGQKGPAKEDLEKSDWYLKKAAEIKSKLKYPNELYNNGVE